MSGRLDLDALTSLARRAATAGGAVVRQAFGSPARDLVAKGPGDWVSAADMASERTVRTALEDGMRDLGVTGIPVFGEEEGAERAPLGWLVDPLDGTANFLHGFPAVAVSVALVGVGVPVVGVVHAPLLEQTWWAHTGSGAFKDGRPLRVGSRAFEAAICATGFPFRKKRERLEEYLPVFARVLGTAEDLRRAGSASLDLAWTAEGVFDGYFEQALGPWDVAAGALLVREAGGVVTDWRGDPGAWLESGDIVAAPAHVHERLLAAILA